MPSAPRHRSPQAPPSADDATSAEQIARRLARVEGQVRGLQRMHSEGRSYVEFVTQVAAVKAALDQVALALLDDHVRHTVSAEDGDRAVTEALDAVARLLRAR